MGGGYEDDIDYGEEFYFTGSGGRDLKGNRRNAEQSCSQKLTAVNLALAKNCNAPINVKGASAGDNWREGMPIRVVRSRNASKFAPERGYRYDGIYKVVSYWQETGKSGFMIYRYHLRRDDIEPAPWTEEGKQRIKELGIKFVEGTKFHKQDAKKKRSDTEEDKENAENKTKKKVKKVKKAKERRKKFHYIDTDNEDEEKIISESENDEKGS